MPWTTTQVAAFAVGDHRLTISDCVYTGAGYGGGLSPAAATGATGPTKNDLGFASTLQASFTALCAELPKGATASAPGRKCIYNPTTEQLIVGATAATDISDTTYRIVAIGRYIR